MDRVARVAGHLIQNAMEASPTLSTTIGVRLTAGDGNVTLEISDTGVGMSETLSAKTVPPLPDHHKRTAWALACTKARNTEIHRRAHRGQERYRLPAPRFALSFPCYPRAAIPDDRQPRGQTPHHRGTTQPRRSRCVGRLMPLKPLPPNDAESAISQIRRYEPAVITLDLGLPPNQTT